MTTLYDALLAAGCEMENHESDLYAKITPLLRKTMRDWIATPAGRRDAGLIMSAFTHTRTGDLWLEIPFAFAPWWRARLGEQPAQPAGIESREPT